MKINFNQGLKTMKGEDLKQTEDEVLTLETIAVEALLSQTEEKTTGKDKAKKYKLAQKISDGGEIELESEDIVLIKQLVGRVYPPLVVGQAYDMLEQNVEEGD